MPLTVSFVVYLVVQREGCTLTSKQKEKKKKKKKKRLVSSEDATGCRTQNPLRRGKMEEPSCCETTMFWL